MLKREGEPHTDIAAMPAHDGATPAQPLNSDCCGVRRMLTLRQVLELIPLSRSTILRMAKNGAFPQARLIAPMKLGFYLDEIVEWQKSLEGRTPDGSDGKPGS